MIQRLPMITQMNQILEALLYKLHLNKYNMNRTEIINGLISKNGYKSYLEIGCQNNRNFNLIICQNKIGIDPERGGTIQMTSDDYFKSIEKEGELFDIVFIDGLHHKEQVIKDVKNTLKHLSKKGTIILHDCLPTTEEMQKVPRIQKVWTGNVWEAIVELRKTRINLNIFTIDTDMGCGVIQFGKQEKLINEDPINYKNFEKNKKKWMNIISIEEFKEKYI